MYLEKLKEAFVNQSMLKKNLSWFFDTPFLPSRIFLWKTGVKQRNMHVENLHLQQFRSASLIIHFSQIIMDLKKVEEVFLFQYLMNENLFHFLEISFQMLRNASRSWLVKTGKQNSSFLEFHSYAHLRILLLTMLSL